MSSERHHRPSVRYRNARSRAFSAVRERAGRATVRPGARPVPRRLPRVRPATMDRGLMEVRTMGYAFGSIDELGEGYGFRKVRHALGVTAFGVNAIVYPPGYEGFNHYHDMQDELYFVHAGTARVELGGEERTIGAGGLLHVESSTPRKLSNASDADD